MQITDGGGDAKDGLKAELRMGTASWNSVGDIHFSKSYWPGLNAWSERDWLGQC